MNSIYDLLQRVQALVHKYEKYDSPIKTNDNITDDPFLAEYQEVEAELEKLLEAAHDVSMESNRAQVANRNAEIRRAKNVLLTDALDALEKKVKKGKGVTKEVITERRRKIQELGERVWAVPDGLSLAANKKPFRAGGRKGTKNDPIILDSSGNNPTDNEHVYAHNEQTTAFEKEWKTRQKAQDQVLDRIQAKVVMLGDLARTMGEEVDKQNPVLDDIEQQVDKNTNKIKSSNVKLKALITKLGTTRNFCVDVILIIILLAIGGYIASTFT